MDNNRGDMKTYGLDDQMTKGVVKDGGNSWHTLVYKTTAEKMKIHLNHTLGT